MGIDMTNLAPAAGAGAGCPCGPGSPASNTADVSFERLVELASDGPAAAESNPSPGSVAGQPGPHDSGLHAAPNQAAQQATADWAAIAWQQAPAEARASRKPESRDPSLLGKDGATDETQSSGGPENPWAALVAGSAIAVYPPEPPNPRSEGAEVGSPGTIGDGSLDEKAPGRTVGSSSQAAGPPQTDHWTAAPAPAPNAAVAETSPKASLGPAAWPPQERDPAAAQALDVNAAVAETGPKGQP